MKIPLDSLAKEPPSAFSKGEITPLAKEPPPAFTKREVGRDFINLFSRRFF
jgi:hypothetical protein